MNSRVFFWDSEPQKMGFLLVSQPKATKNEVTLKQGGGGKSIGVGEEKKTCPLVCCADDVAVFVCGFVL